MFITTVINGAERWLLLPVCATCTCVTYLDVLPVTVTSSRYLSMLSCITVSVTWMLSIYLSVLLSVLPGCYLSICVTVSVTWMLSIYLCYCQCYLDVIYLSVLLSVLPGCYLSICVTVSVTCSCYLSLCYLFVLPEYPT